MIDKGTAIYAKAQWILFKWQGKKKYGPLLQYVRVSCRYIPAQHTLPLRPVNNHHHNSFKLANSCLVQFRRYPNDLVFSLEELGRTMLPSLPEAPWCPTFVLNTVAYPPPFSFLNIVFIRMWILPVSNEAFGLAWNSSRGLGFWLCLPFQSFEYYANHRVLLFFVMDLCML